MNDFTLHIKEIIVTRLEHGTDLITISTDLPSPFPEGVSNPYLILKFEALRRSGEEYVRENFGIEPKVIDVTKM